MWLQRAAASFASRCCCLNFHSRPQDERFYTYPASSAFLSAAFSASFIRFTRLISPEVRVDQEQKR
jgi:hypothetical protein